MGKNKVLKIKWTISPDKRRGYRSVCSAPLQIGELEYKSGAWIVLWSSQYKAVRTIIQPSFRLVMSSTAQPINSPVL